jgi:hypothetical protein
MTKLFHRALLGQQRLRHGERRLLPEASNPTKGLQRPGRERFPRFDPPVFRLRRVRGDLQQDDEVWPGRDRVEGGVDVGHEHLVIRE